MSRDFGTHTHGEDGIIIPTPLGDGNGNSSDLTTEQTDVLKHFRYDEPSRKLIADRAIETTLNSLYLGEQHKMSSGAENIFFTNLGNDTNFYPMWGGLKDQSLTSNQGAGGFIPPSGRVYSDLFNLPLGGNPNPVTSTGYSGGNFFGVNIAGLGVTTTAAEQIDANIRLEYRLSVNGRQVYMQVLPRNSQRSNANTVIFPNDIIEWWFDHPVEIHAGTTIFAEIHKVREDDDEDLGVFQVRQGDTVDPNTGELRYQAIVHNRLFEDKDLELISPYLKYQAMDFGLDATGATILLRDLSLGTDTLLVPHAINTLQAVAVGTTIQVKLKGGQKIIVENLPVSGVTINGSLVNSVLNQAVVQLNDIFTNTVGFTSDDTFVNSFTLSGTDLTLGLNDGTSYTSDVTTLGVDTNNFVASGELSGSDLILTMGDGTTVTIDASNMINGSTSLPLGSEWYYSYGDRADESVGNSISDLNAGIAPRAPFYFGTALTRGSEFKWNANNNKAYVLGLWDGATHNHSGTYNSRQQANWSTGFWRDTSGYRNGSNTTLTNTTSTGRYVTSANAPVVIRFLNNGHLVLVDLSGGGEVEIARTTNPLVDTTFNMQLGCDAQFVFPNAIVSESDNLWEIVHDFDSSENGILDGIEDHTVIKSGLSIQKGEKMMFMLDEVGNGDNFGTGYTHASTGVSTAEDQLENHFKYQTNEALVFTQGGANDWTMSTSADGYFFAANLHQYRNGGGSGTVQGMFSLRFNNDGKLTIYDEDAGHKVATATADPVVGSSVHLYMGVRGNRTYSKIPVISKQSLSQSNQPDSNYVPTVANQTVTVTEADVMNFQIATSDNIVNQFAEVDAPSWMFLSQTSGVLSGTAPAFTGTSADTIVVTCKAGNAIGGSVDFTVTVSVTEAAASYTNSKSLQFDGSSSYLQGNASTMTALERTSNGDGNAWTISMWYKPSSSTSTQTLFVYGDASYDSSGTVIIQQHAGNNILVTYGNQTDKIIILATSCLTVGSWNHLVVTFDGGTTGSTAADLADYYSRFAIAVDGTVVSQIGSFANNGYSGSISGSVASASIFRIGRDSNVFDNYLDGVINQVGVWATDQSANLAAIYNSGATQDLGDLTVPPTHYYEIETSVTSVPDLIGSAGLTGYNFTASTLVTDTP